MKTKTRINFVVIAIILAVVVYAFYFQKIKKPSISVKNDQNNTKTTTEPKKAEKKSDVETQVPVTASTTESKKQTQTELGQGTFSNGSEMEEPAPDILVVQVIHDGIKFSPSRITIKTGDVVIFKNTSLVDIWPLAESLETYPEFNSGKAIAPNATWSFKFTKSGTWKYKDSMNNVVTGVIKVE